MQRIDIDAQLCRGWNSKRFGFRYGFTHALLLEICCWVLLAERP
jgi:hypothetical protein